MLYKDFHNAVFTRKKKNDGIFEKKFGKDIFNQDDKDFERSQIQRKVTAKEAK